MTSLENISIGKKLTVGIVIFVFPIVLLAYFLVVEKDDLIRFTRAEIAGVHYLHATSTALNELSGSTIEPAALDRAAAALSQAEQEDAGTTAVTSKSQDLLKTLRDKSAVENPALAISHTIDLITSISDNSNITLDPDTDTYFTGDMVVNQAPNIFYQTRNLLAAAQDLGAVASDEQKIAYAEARDGLIGSAANFSSDLEKALKGNAGGSLKTALEGAARNVSAEIDRLAEMSKSNDPAKLRPAADAVVASTHAFMEQADVDLERLLNARIAGFRYIVVTRLSIAVLAVLIGALVSWQVIRSITRPLTALTILMKRLAAGDLAIEISSTQRGDGIGDLARALGVFKDNAYEARRLTEEQLRESDAKQRRALRLDELTRSFEHRAGELVGSVSSAAAELENTAQTMSANADQTSKQSSAVLAAVEHTSANVQSVAGASEELSASIGEIGLQVTQSAAVAERALDQAGKTSRTMEGLSEAAQKIGEVINLIQGIAGQTNLLALNATIEAARAGEAGKGFAVVASEVKALANQTGRATSDIQSQVAAIQAATNTTMGEISQIGRVIGDINEGTTAIAAAIEEQRAATSEITRNVSQAAQGAEEVASNVSGVSAAARETGIAAHRVLGAAAELSQQAASMRREVETFIAAIRIA
jgi:methyl-accepting chemotaxis protein